MYEFSLEKYKPKTKGKTNRYTCPQCNQKETFVRYIDKNGNYLAENVGRCNRESKCGYHYKPRDYFAANPTTRKQRKAIVSRPESIIRASAVDFLDKKMLEKRIQNHTQTAFVTFLVKLFPDQLDAIKKAVRDYKIGTFDDGRTIFWQIDKNGKIRSGKLIAYDEATGKRRKDISPSWVHSELANTGEVKKDFNLEQCLFGEHLVTTETSKPIAIVEAEKTAIIASLFFPEMIWMAAGGKTMLQIEKLKRLGRRTIILYPDADAFERWEKIAAEAKGLGINIKVSSIIETKATDIDKTNGTDLADYLVEQQQQKINQRSELKILNSELLLDKIFNDKNLSADFETIFEERMAINVEVYNCTEEEAEKLVLQPESLKRIIEGVLNE